jgi:H+-transporting ATPase
MSSPKEERRATLDPTDRVIDRDKLTEIDLEDGSMEADSQTVGGKLWFTDSSIGLTREQVEVSLEANGKNEVPIHTMPTYVLFLKQFMGFMPFLIEIAAIVSIALQDYVDFAIIVAMLFINGLLGFREEYHAKKALEELSNSIESEVTVIRDGNPVVLPISEIVQGDIVLLVGGTVIPADITWVRGDVMSLDTAALTGEPIPRKYPGEHGGVMLAGTTVKAGECYGQVVAVGTKTEMGQAQADVFKDKSVTVVSIFQQKIMLVVKCTISFSLILVVAALLVQGIARDQFTNGHWRDAVLSALSILIAAIPIALPLVIQVNMALGASFLAKEHHAIVTSLPALQDIASMSILCSDKTGTLTTANMSIIPESTYAVEGALPEEVLLYAYLSANADKKDDPIDRAIITAFEQSEKAKALLESGKYKQETIIGFNPEVKRVVAFVKHHDGETMTIAKGLVAKVLNTKAGGEDDGEIQWTVDQINDTKFIEELEEKDYSLSKAGYKTIGISICTSDALKKTGEPPQFRFVGLLPMLDPPRHDTAATINSLHHANISVKMITGDHANIGRETARLIGLGTNILPGTDIRGAVNQRIKKELIWEADGFAAVLPSDKRDVVMTLKDEYKVVVGMTGDGVNDAPALSAAQVGIAVEGATDAAKNAADLILTQPGLSPIFGAVVEARRIFARIKSYVVYRIAASLTLVMTLSIAIYISGCAVDPLFVIVLALFNDVSMIPVAYDHADATARPQLPRAGQLVALSSYFAICQTALALIMFYVVAENKLADFDLAPDPHTGTCNGETQGFIWLYLLIATELMIFSARSPSFFWTSLPSLPLIGSVLATCAVGIVMARFAPLLGTSNKNVGWIVLANAIVFLVVDLGKVAFRNMIGDGSAEIIEGDGLVEAADDVAEKQPQETDAVKQLKKQMRYQVHMESVVPEATQRLSIVVENPSFAGKMMSVGGVSFTDGFVQRPVAPGIAFARN